MDLSNISDVIFHTVEHKAKFQCHNFEFSLSVEELTKIPYLNILCANAKDFKEKPDNNGIVSLNESIFDPDLMKVIIKYIKTDRPRCLFSDLPNNLNASKLFEFLDYLCIEKPISSLDKLNEELKNVVSIRDKYGNSFQQANRSLARDACVKLCWSGRDLIGPKDQSKFYNMILFIISHPRTFYFRLREVTFNWYLQYFEITSKQQAILQKWLDCGKEDDDVSKSSSGGSHYSDSDQYGYNSDSEYSSD